jgi:hypothetical protein
MTIAEIPSNTTNIIISTQKPKSKKKLTVDDSIYALMKYSQKENFLKENYLSWKFREFKSLNTTDTHDDALKRIPIKLLDHNYLDKYLKSEYSKLSDEDFLDSNSFDKGLLFNTFLGSEGVNAFIRTRLDLIQAHNPSMIVNRDLSAPVDVKKAIKDHHLSLREMRRLQTEKDIEKIFEYSKTSKSRKKSKTWRTVANLSLLSQEQQMSIRGKKLFTAVVYTNDRSDLQKFMPKMDPEVLNALIPKMKRSFYSLPYGIIPIFDHSNLSDKQFAGLIRYHNIEELDKIEMDEDKLRGYVQRIIHLTTIWKKVTNTFTLRTGKPTITTNVPLVNVFQLERIPDSVFKRINFSTLNKEELFHLFHLGTIRHIKKIGEVLLEDNDDLWKFTLYQNDGYCGSTYTKKGLKQRQKQYNKRRLSLLSAEQYESIRKNLHIKIIHLGDSIHGKVT